MVVQALERQEGMDRGHHGGILAPEPKSSAPGKRVHRIADRGPSPAHHRRAWNVAVVDEAGQAEIAGGELHGNGPHVPPYLVRAGRIRRVALQLDAAAVGQWLEDVGRSVLVDPHGDLAARLDSREAGGRRLRTHTAPTLAASRQDEYDNGAPAKERIQKSIVRPFDTRECPVLPGGNDNTRGAVAAQGWLEAVPSCTL